MVSRLLLAAAGVAAALMATAATAPAHSSPCHPAHSCPSDHHTYPWNGLWCTSDADERLAADAQAVVYDGRTYWCHGGSAAPTPAPPAGGSAARISRVVDGDTVELTGGRRVRLVQIDTPEVYFGTECYGPQASALAKKLLPPGTLVRLTREPATDAVDSYGRLLRYVVRVRDGLNVNIRLVADGAAAPYFYGGRRGRYAATLERLALQARERDLGLWGHCPGTPYRPDSGVSTGSAT